MTLDQILGELLGANAITRILKRGSKGDDVKAVQQALIDGGYLKDPADGDFGPGTEKATKAFQKAKGISVDGVVGPATVAALGLQGIALPKLVDTANTPVQVKDAAAKTVAASESAPVAVQVAAKQAQVKADAATTPAQVQAAKEDLQKVAVDIQKSEAPSFFLREYSGVPVYGWGALAAGGLVGLVVLLRVVFGGRK